MDTLLLWLAIASIIISALVWWLFLRNASFNEYASGAEIDEEELAEATEREFFDPAGKDGRGSDFPFAGR
jgi:hypothetical protein